MSVKNLEVIPLIENQRRWIAIEDLEHINSVQNTMIKRMMTRDANGYLQSRHWTGNGTSSWLYVVVRVIGNIAVMRMYDGSECAEAIDDKGRISIESKQTVYRKYGRKLWMMEAAP